MPSPPNPEQPIRDDEKQEANECRQQVEEVQIANGKVDTNCTAESGAAHDCNDLGQTPIERRTSSHEEKKTADGTQPTAKAGPIMGNKGDQCRRDSRNVGGIEPDKSQVRRDEDPGHPKDRDREPRENKPHGAGP